MSFENVCKFEERLRNDEAMRARLLELTEAFDGDRQDTRAVFEAVVGPLAAEVGLPYTYDEALEYAAQIPDDEGFTVDELKAVAGGFSDVCAFVGFGDVSVDYCTTTMAGYSACAGVGVGFAVA